jgi:hypothetical protein
MNTSNPQLIMMRGVLASLPQNDRHEIEELAYEIEKIARANPADVASMALALVVLEYQDEMSRGKICDHCGMLNRHTANCCEATGN